MLSLCPEKVFTAKQSRAIGGINMNFGELFGAMELPILICKDDERLSLLYGNEEAALLLRDLKEALQSKQPLKELLVWQEKGQQRLACFQRGELTRLELLGRCKVAFGRGPSVRIVINRLKLEEGTVIRLCLMQQEATSRSDYGLLLIRALRAAHQEASQELAIERILLILGTQLRLQRLSVMERNQNDMLQCSYEYCGADVEKQKANRQEIPHAQLYPMLMETELASRTEGCAFQGLEESVSLSSAVKSILSAPILFGGQALAYLIAEDGAGRFSLEMETRWILEESADLLAYFLVQREEFFRLNYHLDVLNTVANHFDDMVCVHDPGKEEILFANRALSEGLGVPMRELCRQNSVQMLEKLGWKAGTSHCEEDELAWEFHNACSGKWYLANQNHMQWIDGRKVQMNRMVDITERKEHETALEQIASMDMMTGAYNREWGGRLLARLLEHKEHPMDACLVFLDMDHLKCVNDQFGHCEGDEMIKQTIQIIRSCIRKTDVICRWGGDEFLIILYAAETETLQIMEKIQEHMDVYNARDFAPYRLSFSYGLSEIHAGTKQCVESLIAEADQKMYYNKVKRLCNETC